MKKFCLLWMVLSLILAVPVSASETQPTAMDNISCYSLDAAQAVLGKEELVENADSIIVYERNSSTLMYAWNADERVYPASLVKIMTS